MTSDERHTYRAKAEIELEDVTEEMARSFFDLIEEAPLLVGTRHGELEGAVRNVSTFRQIGP